LLAAERYNESEPVNLGSSFEISIKDLLDDHRPPHRLRRADRLGHDQAQRPAAAQAVTIGGEPGV
jgi:hypothetical protein